MSEEGSAGVLRIGELSKRTGVSPELLRAWERRYGVLLPERSEGGFRLYSLADEERIRRMQRHLSEGMSAAQAASLALRVTERSGRTESPESPLLDLAAELSAALDRFDESAAQSAFDRLLDMYTADHVLRDVVLPYLKDLGDRWEAGLVSIAQEHFASSVIKGRLSSLARGWESGSGRFAILACLPGERHELGLLCFGIALRNQGWRIAYLGSDTPVDAMARAAETLRPDVVLFSGTTSDGFGQQKEGIRALSSSVSVIVAGPGATSEFAVSVGARTLSGDPISAAQAL
jgi:DNA-binding transcriptional MerR regulator